MNIKTKRFLKFKFSLRRYIIYSLIFVVLLSLVLGILITNNSLINTRITTNINTNRHEINSPLNNVILKQVQELNKETEINKQIGLARNPISLVILMMSSLVIILIGQKYIIDQRKFIFQIGFSFRDFKVNNNLFNIFRYLTTQYSG